MQIVKYMTFVIVCFFSFSTIANQDVLIVPCGENCTVADLAKIQSQTLILKAQEAKKAVEKRINELKDGRSSETASEQQGLNGQMFPQPGMPYTGGMQVEQKKEAKAPAVASIMGSNGKLYAIFKLSDGSELQAGEGGSLPGGYVVSKITLDEVMLSKNGKVLRAANAL